MLEQPSKNTEYSVQAVVIPRGYDADQKMLQVCLAFALLPPKSSPATIPADLRNWPTLINTWLRTANLRIDSKALRFRGWWPRDMEGWKLSDSQEAWSALFAKVPFGEADKKPQQSTGRELDKLHDLYSEPKQLQAAPEIEVNPASASDLRPAHRLESPNPKAISEGLAAEHFRRIREEKALVRADLDARYVAALGPERLGNSVRAFVAAIHREPERYGHVVAAALPALVGLVADGVSKPQNLLDVLPRKHREEIVGEFVAFQLREDVRSAAQEYQRIDRQIQSARNRVPVKRKDVERELKSPTFQQLIARIRQYPGLARRLQLVVHGAIAMPPSMPEKGLIVLDWSHTPGAKSINWKKPATHFYFKDGVFRPQPKFEDAFAPTQLQQFYRSHIFDPELYRVTQQDMIRAAAQIDSQTIEFRAKPAIVVEDPDPPGKSFPDLEAEIKRHKSNAVLFVNAPKIPEGFQRSTASTPSSADAIDYRLRQSNPSLNVGDGQLYAEDLMVGVSVFARPVRPGAKLPWYSLCRRIVHVKKDGRIILPPFEEEGFIATGTNLLPRPEAGLVKATVPSRADLLQQKVVEKLPNGTAIRRQHTTIKIQRLMTGNKILVKDLPPSPLARPAHYHGNFRAFVTADDVYEQDIIHATLGKDNEYTDIEVIPRLMLVEDLPDKPALTVILAKGATKQRDDQRFAIGLDFDRTQCLNEKGKLLSDGKNTSCQVFYNDQRKKKSEFFVEGRTRNVLAGPQIKKGNKSSLLYEVETRKVGEQPLSGATIAIHKSIPSGVLRRQHLKDDDEYRALPLARPSSKGYTKDKVDPADVREVVTPLTHIRGTVSAIGFDMTVTLKRQDKKAPERTFLNIAGQPWELQFEEPNGSKTQPGQLAFPRLYADPVPAVVRDLVVDGFNEEELNILLTSLAPVLLPLPLSYALSPVPLPLPLSSALSHDSQLPPRQQVPAAMFGRYYIDNSRGGLAITIDPFLAATLAPVNNASEQIRVHLVGQVTTGVAPNGKRQLTLQVASGSRLPDTDAQAKDTSLRIKWLLSINQSGVSSPTSVEYDTTDREKTGKLLGYYKTDLDGDKVFLHPLDCHGFLVDCVTDGNGSRVGRAWPQALPGSTYLLSGETQVRQVFVPLGGLLIDNVVKTEKFPEPSDKNVVTGYHLLRPIGENATDDHKLTSGRILDALNAGAKDPNEVYQNLVKQFDPKKNSYLIWNADAKNHKALPLVAEVRPPKVAENGEPLKTRELITIDQKTASFPIEEENKEDNEDSEFQPPFDRMPRRRLSDLLPGELVLACGHVVPDRKLDPLPEAGRFVIDLLDDKKSLNLSSGARGTFESLPLEVNATIREGSEVGRAILHTPGQSQILVRWSGSDLQKAQLPKNGTDVMTVITPVILAETISLWGTPKETTEEQTYVSALASDVIAKWANWCLTVRMPGDSDDPKQQLEHQTPPFEICCDRDHSTVDLLPESQVGKWELPPLRFGEKYEFLLRRVDFAGNHLYDELAPAPDIADAACRKIQSMMEQTVAAQALFDPAIFDDHRFVRADLPHTAPLGFPVDRPRPVWQAAPLPGQKELDCRDFQVVAFPREPLLVLFSDVLGRVESLADDAGCFLLPPAAPVETVLMHGVFDRYDPISIPYVIRCHERFMVQGFLGVDRRGQLNYFGDPQVKKLRFDFVFRQAAVLGDGAPADKSAESSLFDNWPVPCPVRLRIVPAPSSDEDGSPRKVRKNVPMTAEALAQSCQIVHAPDQQAPVIHAVMPPGGYGSARVLPVILEPRTKVDCPQDIGQRIHLLHVTNGAWLRPRWIDLREDPALKRNETSHQLDGSFEVDSATTGGYILSGYWNECWDEGQSLGWEEATIRYPDGDLAKLPSIPVEDKDRGYGYGTEAVILFTPHENSPTPEILPVLAAVIKDHGIERIDIRSHGKGWTKQLGIRVLRRPPLFRIATAEVQRDPKANGPLRQCEIRITDAGGWYTRPPYVVITDRSGDGYGAKATAVLNGQGGIDHVHLADPGQCYSGDIDIRFYTHQWVQPERPIGLTAPTVVKLHDPNLPDLGEVWHPFGDAKSRRVDYYLTLRPRHAPYLEDGSPTTDGASDAKSIVRTIVPRDSVAMPLDITATARPSPPNIAFPLLAFHWSYSDGGDKPIDDARNYFRGLRTGTLTLTRTEAIRVYLRRPWHQSGAETLGVVVLPVIANSIRISGDLDLADRGVVNRAEDYPNKQGLRNALDGDVIPKPFRDFVSRWGFDPIRNERALPPLGLQHFPRAIADVAYETLNDPTANIASLARLALHAVDYDPVKDLWYSDVVVDLQDVGKPIDTHPFIRLNLVAYQKHGLPRQQSSAIVATDPIPITGQRSLKVTRSHAGRFEFVLSGNFAPDPPKATDFPRRRVIVELQHRNPSLPDDIELLLKPNERLVKGQHVIQEHTLVWSKADQRYRGELTLPEATIASLKASASTADATAKNQGRNPGAHFAIVLREEEFYRTLSAQPSATGERTVMFDNVACAVRTLTSMTFLL